MPSYTTLRLSEPQVRTLLASVRNRIDMYEADLSEAEASSPDMDWDWYKQQLAELRPLEKRLNTAGLRLTGRI